jgi:Cu-processing system permease protein
MKPMFEIAAFEIRSVTRNHWILLYMLFFGALTYGLFQLSGVEEKVILSLTNVSLLIVPLVAILFTIFYLTHADDFLRLMLAQPVSRRALFHGVYWGLALPLGAAYAVGAGVPLALFCQRPYPALLLIVLCTLLTCISVAGAMWVAFSLQDKTKAFGVCLAAWLFGLVLYDGCLMILSYMFSDYPVEGPLLAAMFVNPFDLTRVIMLLHLDTHALMGYSAALFAKFLGASLGVLSACGALVIWFAVAYYAGIRSFVRKDF